MNPYPKSRSLGVDVNSGEAKELLRRAARRKGSPRETKLKYRNSPTKYDGRTYDSATEAEYAGLLDIQLKTGDIKAWKPQHTMELRVDGELITRYCIDFLVTHKDDQQELIEVKGAETKDWRLKWSLTKALLPKGQIKGISRYAILTLVKKGRKGFSHQRQLLDYP